MERKEEAITSHIEIHHHDEVKATSVKQHTTKFMVFFACFIGATSWVYNFDLGYNGAVLLMPTFNKAFGTCAEVHLPTGAVVHKCFLTALQQSLISVSIPFIGLGGAISGPLGTHIGRRKTIQVGCVIVAIGAGGMLGTSGNFTAYMACKCIQGVGLGHFLGAAPIWGVECISANKRGMLMAMFNLGLGLGNMVAAAVCLGSSNFTSNLAWQTPIICQIPLAVLLGLGVTLFPESPRWLLIRGEEQAARKSFAKFYGKDPFSPEISSQVREVEKYIELERSMGTSSNWTGIFRGIDRKRTFTAVLIVVGFAITGSKFIATYSVLFLSQVGISNFFIINVVLALCACFGGLLAPFIVEYTGRRLSLLVGYACMATCMLVLAAVGTGLGTHSSSAKIVFVVALCLWTVIFGATVGPSQAITAPEMHSVKLRTYGQACSTVFVELFSFGASFYTPYMLSPNYGNMGTRVGYFYFGVTTAVLILVFLYVPETGRLTLEQIDDYFLSRGKARNTSLRQNKAIAARTDESGLDTSTE